VILLPIGHDDSAVRRQPWVTYALMAACFLALVATNGDVEQASQRSQNAHEQLVSAIERWHEQPYLRIDARALRALPPDLAEEVEATRSGFALPPDDLAPFEVAAEQAELDAQVAEALRAVKAAEDAHPYSAHGLRPGSIGAWGLFAHMFMHAGWMHLLGNLFMLFIAGPALEDRWGRPLFAAAYALSGLGGALFFALFADDPNLPLVGASGAISGVFGAFLVRFWSTQIRFWYLLWFGFRVWTGTFMRPAYLMLPLWLANEVLQAWLTHALGVSSGVANTAHIGGFLTGGALALAVKLSQLDARIDRAIDAKTTVQGNLALADALGLREQGDLAGAIRQLALLVKKSPRDAEAVDAYWDACAAAGCAGDAAHVVLALAQRELAANDGARAAQRFVEVRAALPDYGFDASFVARLLPHLRDMDSGIAREALRWLAQPKSGALAPTLALRAIEQARAFDPRLAKQLARKLAATDLPPEVRARFGALVASLDAEAPDPPAGASDGLELARDADEAPAGAAASGRSRSFANAATPDWDHTARAFDDERPAATPTPPLGPELTEPELTSPERDLVSEESAVAAAERIASPGDDWDALKLLDSEDVPAPPAPRFASLKLTEATPLALEGGSLRIGLDGGRKAQLALAKVDAVALAAVRGLGAKPVLVVDLLTGWRSLEGGELRGLRLRSDRFDPRKLSAAQDPLAALRAFVAQLVAASGATPLHAADPKRADALTPFADAASYEREVLEVGT
jgi:membrane associated rhomboid family serine protease